MPAPWPGGPLTGRLSVASAGSLSNSDSESRLNCRSNQSPVSANEARPARARRLPRVCRHCSTTRLVQAAADGVGPELEETLA